MRITDALGNTVRYRYTAEGWLERATDAAANAALGVTRFHLLLLGLSVLCIVSVSFRLSLYFDC